MGADARQNRRREEPGGVEAVVTEHGLVEDRAEHQPTPEAEAE